MLELNLSLGLATPFGAMHTSSYEEEVSKMGAYFPNRRIPQSDDLLPRHHFLMFYAIAAVLQTGGAS